MLLQQIFVASSQHERGGLDFPTSTLLIGCDTPLSGCLALLCVVLNVNLQSSPTLRQ